MFPKLNSALQGQYLDGLVEDCSNSSALLILH